MTTAAKRSRWRRPFWIAAAISLAIKIGQGASDWDTPLSVPANVILVVAGFFAFRWVVRRFLFKVSRRLAAAFLFVGVTPLLCAALLAMFLTLGGLFQVMNADVQRAYEDVLQELDAAAGQLVQGEGELEFGEPRFRGISWRVSESGLYAEGDTFTRRLPSWLEGDSFVGAIVRGGQVFLVAMRRSNAPEPMAALVTCPVDDEFAAYLGRRLELEIHPLNVQRIAAEGIEDAPSPSPNPAFDPRPDAPVEIATGDVHLTFSPDEGRSVFCAPVRNWATGDSLLLPGEVDDFEVDRAQVPVLGLRYDTVSALKRHFASGPYGKPMFFLAKVVSLIFAGLALVAILIGVGLTSSVTRAVGALHKGTQRVAGGDLDHRIRVRSKDQLGALAESFNSMTGSVQELLDVRADRDRLEHELRIAADVQRRMLPTTFPTIPGLSGAAVTMMAREVGGDLYDFIRIGNDRVAIVVGDVSGKGVSAALVMSNVVSSLRSLLGLGKRVGPAEVLIRLNRVIYDSTAPDVFVTLFYAEYDMSTGNLVYANAGHDWPVVLRANGEVVELESGGIMLGAMPDVDLTESRVELNPGDVVLAYSDGLVDTENEDAEPYERERVVAVARSVARRPQALVNALQAAVTGWRGTAPEIDDITVVALERTTLPGSAT